MKKVSSLTFVLLFVLAVSCGKSSTGEHESSNLLPYNEPMLATEEGQAPVEAHSFQTNVDLVNFNSTQEQKVLQAAELIRKVIATEEFKEAVINFNFNGQKTFSNNGGLSNLQIYNKILWAAESLRPDRNNALDVELELYTDDTSSTIGYTYANSNRIWMNTKYFNQYTAVDVTDNLFHEWLHKLGFEHDSIRTPERPYSVPYALGYLMERLAQDFATAL